MTRTWQPWKSVQELSAALRPAWLSALISLAVSLVLHHPQPIDVLAGMVADEGLLSAQHLLLSLSLLTLGLCGWYFPRSLLYVRYWFTPADPERFERWRVWAPRFIGVAPIASLALAYGRGEAWGAALLGAAGAVAFLAFVVVRRRVLFRRSAAHLGWFSKLPTITVVAMTLLLALSAFLLLLFLISPVVAPQRIGAIGILFFAMASWIAFGSAALLYPTYRFRLPSLLLIALLLVAVFSLWNDNHGVRTLPAEHVRQQRPQVSPHFASWLAHREPARAEFAAAGKPYPVFIVAAEGGGIRAAYWTASVLGALEDEYPGFSCHVFGISGVSGGSLGAAVFAAAVADDRERSGARCGEPGHTTADRPIQPIVENTLGRDFLAPAMAGMLFSDFLQRFLPTTGRASLPDRAFYLESAWETAWQDAAQTDRFREPFLGLWASPATRYEVPSLFFNGTWVEDGRRNVTSNLRTSSVAFVELDDALELVGRPMRLSTAVHMSARFTYLSPAGTIPGAQPRRRVVDGGYFENSGTLTASELAATMLGDCSSGDAACGENGVAVYALIISNAPTHPAGDDVAVKSEGPAILPETLSPLSALFATRSARGYHADRYLERAMGRSVIRFHLPASDELRVPLGWVLSRDLRERMGHNARGHENLTSVGTLLQR